MTAQHTPGPWAVSGTTKYIHSVEDVEDGRLMQLICNIVPHRPGSADNRPFTDAMVANARLIAAAPDLLNMLRRMVDETSGGSAPCLLTLEQARQALAQATQS